MLSMYKYEPNKIEPAPQAPLLAPRVSETGGQVIMAPARSALRDSRKMDDLHASLAQEKADARSAAIASKLGIGVSSVHLGGNLVAGVATVFYIPIAVGIGFSW
jgi:hypothetical protein